VELYGIEWLIEVWKYIREDKIEHYRVLMSLMPLARTAMDKKGGQAIQKYGKDLERMFEDAIPWRKKASRRRESLRGKVKPGEVVVVLEGTDAADLELYSDAKVVRE